MTLMGLPDRLVIRIERKSGEPIFLQVVNAFMQEIRKGTLRPGSKIPSTRNLAQALGINRNTAVMAIEELSNQGWIKIIPSVGAFVNKEIPELKSEKLKIGSPNHLNYPVQAGFLVTPNKILEKRIDIPINNFLEFDEGLPDIRLAPVYELNRAYRSVIRRIYNKHNLNTQYLCYNSISGNKNLRIALSNYFNATRGLQTLEGNVFTTRGSQMALYLTINTLISPLDKVIVGDTNYLLANKTLINAGAELIEIAVDDFGINTDLIEDVCKRKKIRAIYITPHHHYPTTVTLSAERRVKLLALAEKYGFFIIEDDYDFDFHYSNSPILPLASADTNGMVVYIGSIFKGIAPGIRLGYVVAPANVIEELTKLRRIIDLQGDLIFEEGISEFIKDGELRRHIRKALAEYRNRRDLLCAMLNNKLENTITFKIPNGGMALWATFNKKINLKTLSENALKKRLVISNGESNCYNSIGQKLNAIRMGFASLNPEEMEEAVDILAKLIG
jgi:GntR family transcriptional regulator / MocR family aminotransferase